MNLDLNKKCYLRFNIVSINENKKFSIEWGLQNLLSSKKLIYYNNIIIVLKTNNFDI